jgi:endogenous inhibitor of DNA gyrase (YacG/DUF329 family)
MVEVTCLECGAPYTVYPGKAATAKFCGNDCKFAYQKTHPPRARLPRLTAPCAYCGEPVEYLPSQKGATRKNTRASKKLTTEITAECRRRYEAKEATMTAMAAELGVSVSSMSIAIRQAVYGENVYCDADCRAAGLSTIMTGRRPSNSVYTSHHTFRAIIRREFRDQCSLCGWAEAPCDVAHIISRKDGGDDSIENVTMLCPNHHRMYDCGLIPAEEIRASRENVLKHQPSPLR